ncbi:UPF0280 family protein [Actibacterium sp. 188UL27-1]|uniref:UPF0280 family protein n=1 Tax=Actibacterium sp. 188UL27-1 TaxID=2786961 RepID=UPI00195C140B|nr:UPF0280 family protein [Actibacterium sp. 188UL27-1]MBM7066952.1 UPF0280 family protein [Actibacterium sp. 188UL27-1]
MAGPVAALLEGGARLHLQHGPIDLIIGADGERGRALRAAAARFGRVLDELVPELSRLRSADPTPVQGEIARLMQRAVTPHQGFVTPMAAVAGAVADTVLAAMVNAAALSRAYVNNGGDIALHLTGEASFSVAMAGLAGQDLGRVSIDATDPVRGIATSGRGGRSLSMGIADSVTVLAPTAAMADVAATLIGNAVDLPEHPGIARQPACDLQPDSDLGQRLVVTSVPQLTTPAALTALSRGAALAEDMRKAGLITGAALFLQGQSVTRGAVETQLITARKTLEDA